MTQDEKKKSNNGTKHKRTGIPHLGTKYPALDPKKSIRNRQKLVDYDYLHKLSPDELQWLNDFTEEYTHNGTRKKNNILKGKKEKKDAYDRNNARNRDLHNIIEMYPGLNKVDLSRYEDLDILTEDDIIDLIDLARRLAKGEG